MIQSIKA